MDDSSKLFLKTSQIKLQFEDLYAEYKVHGFLLFITSDLLSVQEKKFNGI